MTIKFQKDWKKKLVLAGAIALVSFIYGLPHIILLVKNGNQYDPLVLSSNTRISIDETRAYAPFVNFILKEIIARRSLT